MIPEALQFGWTPALDIPVALRRVPPESLSAWFALVTVIDSTPKVRRLTSLVPLLRDLGVLYAEAADDVAIEAPTLLRLIDEHEFLTGFDEIWLYAEMPSAGKPEQLRITSDKGFGPEPPVSLAEWMLETRCLAGLGDGDGLNFATFTTALATLWRG